MTSNLYRNFDPFNYSTRPTRTEDQPTTQGWINGSFKQEDPDEENIQGHVTNIEVTKKKIIIKAKYDVMGDTGLEERKMNIILIRQENQDEPTVNPQQQKVNRQQQEEEEARRKWRLNNQAENLRQEARIEKVVTRALDEAFHRKRAIEERLRRELEYRYRRYR